MYMYSGPASRPPMDARLRASQRFFFPASHSRSSHLALSFINLIYTYTQKKKDPPVRRGQNPSDDLGRVGGGGERAAAYGGARRGHAAAAVQAGHHELDVLAESV